jgi:malonyl-CoA decarboxylase
VHEIQGWRDLRRRLESDRRCFAFFHPALPDEPIIFIEVALTKGMSDRVQPLLDPNSPVVDPAGADTAILYSITNCQEGLRGISFGNFLIKQVAEDLGREFPRLKTFATLSPIPGFCRWLADMTAAHAEVTELAELAAALAEEDWFQRAGPGSKVRAELTRLCAYYLLHAKHGKEPADAVARFHLGNGARMERLNWLADSSSTGMTRSAGLMVNYLYRLKEVERNHELYAKEQAVVASPGLSLLARGSLLARLKERQK